MARPTKEEQLAAKRAKEAANNDITNVDIGKLDEALEQDVVKSIGFGNDDDVIVEEPTVSQVDVNTEPVYDINTNTETQEQSHQFEMPPSNKVVIEDDYEVVNDIPNAAQDIPTEDSNPLEEEVKERDYTHFAKPNPIVDANNVPQPEPFIPEPINIISDASTETVGIDDSKASKPNEPVKQDSSPKRETINKNLEDLSPKQKRDAAEKSADALLIAYGNLVPIPFKKISSFNLGKIDNLHLKGDIDKNMVLAEDGTTVKTYCEGVNKEIEQTFEITQEMKDEIRPPLIEVLMENNLALTATQRLIMAVGGQIVQMGLTTFQFMQQNKAALHQFKAFHNENKENTRIASKIAEKNIKINNVKEDDSYTYKTEPKKDREVVYEPVQEFKTETSKNVEKYIDNDNQGVTIDEVQNED